jgi:hypothetical protein
MEKFASLDGECLYLYFPYLSCLDGTQVHNFERSSGSGGAKRRSDAPDEMSEVVRQLRLRRGVRLDGQKDRDGLYRLSNDASDNRSQRVRAAEEESASGSIESEGCRLDCKPCRLWIGFPTIASSDLLPRGGFNRVGIPPDVRIEPEVADKIRFIVDYFAKS